MHACIYHRFNGYYAKLNNCYTDHYSSWIPSPTHCTSVFKAQAELHCLATKTDTPGYSF